MGVAPAQRWLLLELLLGLLPARAHAEAAAEAAVLHAEALIAEFQGDTDYALSLLRKASDLDPQNRDVAVDRARLALDSNADLSAADGHADVVAFLAIAPLTLDEETLRAEALLRVGDVAAAEQDLVRMKTPTDERRRRDREALQKALESLAPPERFVATVRLGTEYDTNVTLGPNDPSLGLLALIDPNAPPGKEPGFRTVLDGSLEFVPVLTVPTWKLHLDLSIGRHLGKALNLYDWFDLRLSTSIVQPLGPLELDGEVFGELATAAGFRRFYDKGTGAHVELRLPATVTPGIYVEVHHRNFVTGNDEGTDQDRDGVSTLAGVLAEWGAGPFALLARAGYQGDVTQGPSQRQRGIDASLLAVLGLGSFDAGLGLAFEWRRYGNKAGGSFRNDRRLIPQVDLRWAFVDWLAVRGSWFFVRNVSQGKLDYTRHVLSLGLEGVF